MSTGESGGNVEAFSAEATLVKNFQASTLRSTSVLHFTGGLVAIPVEIGGFILGPGAVTSEGLTYIGPFSRQDIDTTAAQAGCYYVGTNQINEGSGPERSQFWYPTIGSIRASEQSSDSWSAISNQAHIAQDKEYSCIARYLCISLRSASLRLRDVSNLHKEQLEWALLRHRRSGERFANIALHDLYLSMHSLLAEMCSARDYLVQLAAKRIGAKPGTDSLAKLQEWLKKEKNRSARDDAMIQLLTNAVGSKESPGWLAQLGEMRNMFIHRQPMAAHPDSAALLFRSIATKHGFLPSVRLSRYARGEKFVEGEDPFVTFLRFWLGLEALSQASVLLSPYAAEHPCFVVADE